METLDQLRRYQFDGVVATLQALNFEGEVYIKEVGDVVAYKVQPDNPDSKIRYMVNDGETVYVRDSYGEWLELEYGDDLEDSIKIDLPKVNWVKPHKRLTSNPILEQISFKPMENY